MPDITLFFDVMPEVARARGGYGEERYESEELQARVREQFVRIGAKMGHIWKVIDAGKGREEVSEDVWAAIAPLLAGESRAQLGRLWPQ
jgi:dTMP kinase